MLKQIEDFNLKWIWLCSWENNRTVTNMIVLGQAVCAFFSTQISYTGILTIGHCCVCFCL